MFSQPDPENPGLHTHFPSTHFPLLLQFLQSLGGGAWQQAASVLPAPAFGLATRGKTHVKLEHCGGAGGGGGGGGGGPGPVVDNPRRTAIFIRHQKIRLCDQIFRNVVWWNYVVFPYSKSQTSKSVNPN